jgi:hypothetical protein
MKQMPKLVALFVAEPVMRTWKAGSALLVRRVEEPMEEMA